MEVGQRTEEAFVGGDGREAVGPSNGSDHAALSQRLRRSKKMIAAILAANQQRALERLDVGGKLLAISPPSQQSRLGVLSLFRCGPIRGHIRVLSG